MDEGHVPKGSYLLMESLDRMSRDDPWDSISELRSIVKRGITLVTMSDGKAYGASSAEGGGMDLMMAVLVLTRAHEESAIKSKRLKAAWSEKRKNAGSRPITSMCPAWLELSSDKASFLINKENSKIVKRIYSEYLRGMGTHGIAHKLNEEEVPTFGRSSYWHRSYITKILDNSAVIGRFIPHIIQYDSNDKRIRVPQEPIEDYYPSVISREDFESVQAMRRDRRNPSISLTSKAGVSHMLAGLAICPKCRGSMLRVSKAGKNRSAPPKLVCSRAKVGAGCEYHGVKVEEVENAIRTNIEQIVYAIPKGSTTQAQSIELAKEQDAKIQTQIKRLLKFLEDTETPDDVAFSSVSQRLQELENSSVKIRKNIDANIDYHNRYQFDDIKNRAMTLKSSIESEPAQVNAALRRVFSNVVVDWERRLLKFHWLHGGTALVRY